MGINRIKQTISKFKDTSILVLGDCMMDQWVWGKVKRISPEAPVPVVDVDYYTYTPGGAANVVNNLRALGANVSLVGIIGKDFIGNRLKRDLRNKGVEVKGIITDSTRPTTLKTRIVAHNQQVVRADYEKKDGISKNVVKELLKFLEKSQDFDCLLISDYNKGMISEDFMKKVIPLFLEKQIKIIAGPKPENISFFKNITVVTLNQREASQACGFEIKDAETLCLAGEKILIDLKSGAVLITRGEEGMSLFDEDGQIHHIPALSSQVYDVSGAGDTVISVLALALSCGSNLLDATILSNYAAAIVVKKVGTATVTTQELVSAIR